jgi:hypothetical protein
MFPWLAVVLHCSIYEKLGPPRAGMGKILGLSVPLIYLLPFHCFALSRATETALVAFIFSLLVDYRLSGVFLVNSGRIRFKCALKYFKRQCCSLLLTVLFAIISRGLVS